MCVIEILISVIIPVYNGEKYIKDTVMSVINQPYKNVEVLLINDGSSDNSDNICGELVKKYPNVYYYEKENEGIGATRNYGITKANGHYLAFLDQDDMWIDNFLDKDTVSKIKAGGDIIGFSYYRGNSNMKRGKAIRVSNGEIRNGGIKAVQSSWNHHSSFLFSRAMLVENNITCPLTRHEDEIFRHKCQYVSKCITYINRMMFIYRNNPASETHRKQRVELLYGPLLDSWYQLMEWHKHFHSTDDDIIILCINMMCVFSIEAIEMLYQSWRKEKEIGDIIEKYLYKNMLDEYKNIIISEQSRIRISKFYSHHCRFVLENRIKGLFYKFVKKMLRYPFVRQSLDKLRYPEVIG